jgi:hypothetical protein
MKQFQSLCLSLFLANKLSKATYQGNLACVAAKPSLKGIGAYTQEGTSTLMSINTNTTVALPVFERPHTITTKCNQGSGKFSVPF